MEQILTIEKNEKLTENVFKMVLMGDTSEIKAPGQFINIKLNGFFLRRPISVCDFDEKSVTVIYKVVGGGTLAMSKMEKGESLNCLLGLGNGFDTEKSGDKPLLFGGGVGVPPMFKLAKELLKQGKKVTVILGFNKKDEIFYADEFEKIGAEVRVTTVDGSYGISGFVTDAIPEEYSYFYACGPEPMLKAVYNKCETEGELSFEARMGCGFGACMGCSCKTISGNKRICTEGPVLKKGEIIWTQK